MKQASVGRCRSFYVTYIFSVEGKDLDDKEEKVNQ